MLFYANSWFIRFFFVSLQPKAASTGYASAIQVNLIALGLHRPCPQNYLIVMDYDILQSVSQGSDGAQDAENSRIEAISDELKRRCKLYEAQLGDGQPHVALLKSSSALPNHLPRNTVCGYR